MVDLVKWENEIRQYGELSGKTFDDDLKVALVTERADGDQTKHPDQLRSDRRLRYAEGDDQELPPGIGEIQAGRCRMGPHGRWCNQGQVWQG